MVYRLGLGALGAYLYSQGNGLWVGCAVLLAWSFLQQQIAAIVGVLGRLANIPHEHDANSGATLSDVTATSEYGVTLAFIVNRLGGFGRRATL